MTIYGNLYKISLSFFFSILLIAFVFKPCPNLITEKYKNMLVI